MWLLQALVAFAVLASNVHWQWTPNSYLAGIIAALAVWLLTIFPFQLRRWVSAWRLKLKAWLAH